MLDKVGNWQPFHTQDRRIGMARRGVRGGDVMCILTIVKAPVVLRITGDPYTLVSFFFVPDIMDGELGGEGSIGKFKVEDFRIV